MLDQALTAMCSIVAMQLPGGHVGFLLSMRRRLAASTSSFVALLLELSALLNPSCGPMTLCVVWCLALGVRLPRMWSACSRLYAGLVLPPTGEACVFPPLSLPMASWLGCFAAGGVSQPCARQRASSWRGLHLSVGALVPLLTVESQPLRVRQLVLVALPAASGRVPVCLQVGVGMCARSGACAPLALRPGRRCGACAACPPVAWSRFKVLECPE